MFVIQIMTSLVALCSLTPKYYLMTSMVRSANGFISPTAPITRLYSKKRVEMKSQPSLRKSRQNTNLIYTPNQKSYLQQILNDSVKMVVATGPAGTGKTMIACNIGIQKIKSGELDKIIVTRPVVGADEDIGFLPGNMEKKMNPWTRPLFDIFAETFGEKEVENMIHQRTIEICPLAYMRGRTFKNAFVIADEMQNSNPNQMKMLTTRIGEGSKLIINGDLSQNDMHGISGLEDFANKYHYFSRDGEPEGIRWVEMNQTDVKRSELVALVLRIYGDSE